MTALTSMGQPLKPRRLYDKTGMPCKLLEDEKLHHAVRSSPCQSVDDTDRGLKPLDGNQIMANPQSTVEAGGSPASERNHVPLAEDASKTIEFLRARLLSERAASRAARQQAQQIARKVSELQSRLDLEMEQRKKAEVAAEEVFAVLKSKGLTTEHMSYAQARKSGLEEGILLPHDSNNLVDTERESSQNACHTISRLGADSLDIPMLVAGITRDVQRGNDFVGKVDTQRNAEESMQPFKEAEKDCKLDSKDNSLEVWDPAISDLVKEQQEIAPEDCEKVMGSQTNKPAGERDTIAKKLNAMLHKLEEEVDNLSDEQPLKFKLQGWVDHIVNVLEREVPSLKSGFPLVDPGKLYCSDASSPVIQGAAECDNASSSCLYTQVGRNMLHSELESLNHVEGLVKLLGKVNADVLRLVESELPLANQLQLLEEVEKKVDSTDASLSLIKMFKLSNSTSKDTNDDMQEKEKNPADNVVSPLSKIRGAVRSVHGNLHPWVSPPSVNFLSNEVMPHRSHASSDTLKEVYTKGAESDMGFLGGLVTLKQKPQVPIYSEVLGMSQVVTGAEWIYPTEAPSPRKSDDSWTGEIAKTRPVIGQWQVYESLPQATISDSEKQARLGTRGIYTHNSFMNDLAHDNIGQNIDFHRNPSAEAAFVGHGNLEFKRRHSYHASKKYGQGREQPLLSPFDDGFELNFQKPRQTRAYALMDDKNGRLGDVLKALHLAREQVKDDESLVSCFEDRVGPSMPTVGTIERSVDNHGDERWQVPYGGHRCRSDVVGQAPIVHLPTSPSSDHGFPALERQDGLRRSNSVSTNFMMPAYLQPRGKVHLGNGITLYTD